MNKKEASNNLVAFKNAKRNEADYIEHATGFKPKYVEKIPVGGGKFKYIYPEDLEAQKRAAMNKGGNGGAVSIGDNEPAKSTVPLLARKGMTQESVAKQKAATVAARQKENYAATTAKYAEEKRKQDEYNRGQMNRNRADEYDTKTDRNANRNNDPTLKDKVVGIFNKAKSAISSLTPGKMTDNEKDVRSASNLAREANAAKEQRRINAERNKESKEQDEQMKDAKNVRERNRNINDDFGSAKTKDGTYDTKSSGALAEKLRNKLGSNTSKLLGAKRALDTARSESSSMEQKAQAKADYAYYYLSDMLNNEQLSKYGISYDAKGNAVSIYDDENSKELAKAINKTINAMFEDELTKSDEYLDELYNNLKRNRF